MVPDCETETAIIYGCDSEQPNGKHFLEIPQLNLSMEFMVGPDMPATITKGHKDYRRVKQIIILCVSINLFIWIHLISSYVTSKFFSAQMEELGNWLFGSGKASTITYFKALLLGPLYHSYRFSKAPKKVRLIFHILHMTIFITPFFFRNGDTVFIVVWFWGYSSGSDWHFDPTALFYQGFYILGTIIPLFYLCGIMTERSRWNAMLIMCNLGGRWFSMITSPIVWKSISIEYIIIRNLKAKHKKEN